MIVLKFGGAALADSDNVQNAVDYIKKVKDKPIVVVSAMKGITDLLLNTIEEALNKNYENTVKNIDEIKLKHQKVINDLVKSTKIRKKVLKIIEDRCNELETLLYSISTLKECTLKSNDYIVSFGEKLSSNMVAAVLCDQDFKSEPFYGEDLIRTDSNFGNAYPDFKGTKMMMSQKLSSNNEIPIITGFIGSNKDGQTTTLGRGGSDFSASIIANCLNADEVWYLKEVDGILTANPNIVKNPTLNKFMTYDEVAELSYFGAKVLHPIAIHPLRQKNIPARIKNVYKYDVEGTLVSDNLIKNGRTIKAITYIRDISLITVQGEGMIGIPGIAGRAFMALAKENVSVLMISQSSSEQNISFAISNKDKKRAIKSLEEEFELEILKKKIDKIVPYNSVSIVSVVGQGMSGTPGISGKVFSALGKNDVNIIMIAQGSSELNISFIIEEKDLKKAINCIHDEFGLGK